jgi:hypothetical protein
MVSTQSVCIFPELTLIADKIKQLLTEITEQGEKPELIVDLELWCETVGINMTPKEMLELWVLTND